jgi:transposase
MKHMSPAPIPVKVRRKFDEAFKRESVQHWLQSGKSAGVIARELGLEPNRLYSWKQGFAPAVAGGEATAGAKPRSLAEVQAQLDVALRENRQLREQRDILKKTLGILSEPSLNAMNGSTR